MAYLTTKSLPSDVESIVAWSKPHDLTLHITLDPLSDTMMVQLGWMTLVRGVKFGGMSLPREDVLFILDRLRDAGKLFWRRDADFKPEKDVRTVRLYVSSPEGHAWELLVTGPKWYDTRAEKGGGGGIDLTMHLFRLPFVDAVKRLSP
jgi:hypothetical protein